MMAAPARAAASVRSDAARPKSKPPYPVSFARTVVSLGGDKAKWLRKGLIRFRLAMRLSGRGRGTHVAENGECATSSPPVRAEPKRGRAPMTEPASLGDLELAALVSSRICHDVINPVAAIANGLEMLGEETDQAMRDAAMDLIRKSAAQASAKLQFARLAFGAAGSAGAEIDLRDAERVARDFVSGTGKHQVNWHGPV